MRNDAVRTTRILFIGLDSAEPELLQRWMDSGAMPALAALRDRSAWGSAETPSGFGNGVAWPSFYTAADPSRHGRYYHRQLRTGTYETFSFDEDRDLCREPLWAALDRAGRRVAVIDMVRSPLVRLRHGIQLADWMSHDRILPTRSWPPELTSEVLARYGDDPLGGFSGAASRREADYVELCEKMVSRIRTKTDMCLEYLGRGGWDLFVAVYADPHDVGHECWHIHDAGHPRHDPELAARIGDPIEKIYVALDRGIGRMLERVGSEADVVFFTTSGMGPRHTGNFVLDEVLRRLEGARNPQNLRFVRQARAFARRFVPSSVRRRLRPYTRGSEEAVLAADRRRRRCFAVPNNSNAGAIRVNLVGREPDGSVRPGAEFDALCKALAEGLLALRNLETGEPVVEEVTRVRDRYHGDQLDGLPDLLVIWRRTARISAVGSPKVGELEEPFFGHRTGDHSLRGMVAIRSPGLAPGKLPAVSVMDVGATLAALLGVPLPDADGAPIRGLRSPPPPA